MSFPTIFNIHIFTGSVAFDLKYGFFNQTKDYSKS